MLSLMERSTGSNIASVDNKKPYNYMGTVEIGRGGGI